MSQLDDQVPDESPLDPEYLARMHRQTRICIWIILIGLANFLAYVIGYWALWGEAIHGEVLLVEGEIRYFLQKGEEVTRGEFIYSGVHSISVWLTMGAVMLAMLTLAKERIASSMRVAILRGRTLITVLATIITIAVIVLTIAHTIMFVRKLRSPAPASQVVVRQPYNAVR
ncbi:MAG: hypothetical protein ACYS8X_06235 [Planctomycetota bacterium]|jgi:hypothetical protein